MALKDIIGSDKYPNDLVISLEGGATATLGEIRAAAAATTRAATLDSAEMAFANKFQEALKAGWINENGKIVAPPQPTNKEIRQAAAQEFGLDENDPLLGEVVKMVKTEIGKRDAQLDAMRNEFTNALGTVTNVVKTSVGRYLDERYKNDFSTATKELPKGVKADYEEAFKYANEHGLKDKDGVLQIAEAVDRMTWQQRKEAERAALREELARDLENKNALASVTRPRTSGPEHHREKSDFDPFTEVQGAHGNKIKVVKSFDDALAEAQNDEELLQSALRTASFGPAQ